MSCSAEGEAMKFHDLVGDIRPHLRRERRAKQRSSARGLRLRARACTMDLLEAAWFLQMAPATLRKRASAGCVPAYRPGKSWVFLFDELSQFLKSRKQSCPSISAPTLRIGGSVSRLTVGKSDLPLALRIAKKRAILNLLHAAPRGRKPN